MVCAFALGAPSAAATATTTAFTGRSLAVVSRTKRAAARPVAAKTRRTSAPTMKTYQVGVELDGKEYTIPVNEDVTLLEAIEEYGLTVDSSCRAGVCMTCAAKVVRGEVDLGEAALADEAKDQGFVLTCSAYPRSDDLKVVMNQFDSAYDMQYGQFEEDQEKEPKSGGGGGLFGLFGKK